MKMKVLVIIGPTASGKSDLAVRLARKIATKKIGGYKGAEIISADSRQVYRGLDIGTGKITRTEMRGVRHHLLNVADPRRQFSVQRFKTLADKAIADITKRGKLPIICGGTGFYIDTVANNAEFPAVKADSKLRARLAKKTPVQLLAMLRKLDRGRWQTIKANNSEKKNARRLIRAIEIARAMRRTMRTEGQRASSIISPPDTRPRDRRCILAPLPPLRDKYDPLFIGLQPSQNNLRRRIHDRLLKRLGENDDAGMIAEARLLHAPRLPENPNGGLPWRRMEEIGLEYRYLSRYLRGSISKDELIERLNTAIWQYARRQMTWFRRNKNIKWFKPDDHKKIGSFILKYLN